MSTTHAQPLPAPAFLSGPLFSALPTPARRALSTNARAVTFAAGETILREGEPTSSVHVITTGRVEALVGAGAASGASAVSWLVPGDMVGEIALLGGGAAAPSEASYVATEPTTCLRLEAGAFAAALGNAGLAGALLQVMARRVRDAERRLAEQTRDPLTGLATRQALEAAYAREVTAAVGRGARRGDGERSPALLFADVNDFKTVNDTYGHAVGDAVLCAVAEALKDAARGTDVVARYGGDEFVVLLLDGGREGVRRVMERVRRHLAANPPAGAPVSVSIGGAVVDVTHPEPLATLMERADASMYRAKARHRRTSRNGLRHILASPETRAA